MYRESKSNYILFPCTLVIQTVPSVCEYSAFIKYARTGTFILSQSKSVFARGDVREEYSSILISTDICFYVFLFFVAWDFVALCSQHVSKHTHEHTILQWHFREHRPSLVLIFFYLSIFVFTSSVFIELSGRLITSEGCVALSNTWHHRWLTLAGAVGTDGDDLFLGCNYLLLSV